MDGQKCEHPQCSCYVDLGQTYCNARCSDNDKRDGDAPAHERCGCRHAGCQGSD